MLRRHWFISFPQWILAISLSCTVNAETALKNMWLDTNKNNVETPVNLSNESSPKGLYDIYGIRNEPTGAFAERASFYNQLAIFQDGVVHDTLTPNRTLYQSPKNLENNCYDIPSFNDGGFVKIVSLNFTPRSPAKVEENLIEIHYSAQINTPRGPNADGVFLKCTVSNANGSVPCSNTENFPALLRQWQDNSNFGNLAMPSYHGYVVLAEEDAGLATTLEIELTSFEGKRPTACSNNIIVRYFD